MISLEWGLSRGELSNIVGVYSVLAAVTTTGFLLSSIVGKLSVLLAGLGIVAYGFGSWS